MKKNTPAQIKEVVDLYKKGKSMCEIERILGLGKGTASYRLKKEQIEIRGKSYYSQGKRNPAWKNGVVIEHNKYLLIYKPDHPYRNHVNRVRKHRLVMEKHLKRYLLPGEVVDHINGNTFDNRLKNLRVFSSNAEHLKATLAGKVPKWTEAGRKRTLDGALKANKQKQISAFEQNWQQVLQLLSKPDHSKNDVLVLRKLKHRLRNKKIRTLLEKKLAQPQHVQLRAHFPHLSSKQKTV